MDIIISDSVNITNSSATAYKSGNSAFLQFSCCAYGSPASIMNWNVTSHNVRDSSTGTTEGHLSTCLQVNATLDSASTLQANVICSAELVNKSCSLPGEQYCKDNIISDTAKTVSVPILGKHFVSQKVSCIQQLCEGHPGACSFCEQNRLW